jgi:hypothetical protein
MQRNAPLRLGDLCEMTVGIKPYQTGKGKPKQTKEMVKQRVFDASYRKDKTYRQYLMGRDISRFVVDPVEERWISCGDWLAEPRPAAPFFEPRRIVGFGRCSLSLLRTANWFAGGHRFNGHSLGNCWWRIGTIRPSNEHPMGSRHFPRLSEAASSVLL